MSSAQQNVLGQRQPGRAAPGQQVIPYERCRLSGGRRCVSLAVADRFQQGRHESLRHPVLGVEQPRCALEPSGRATVRELEQLRLPDGPVGVGDGAGNPAFQ